MNAKFLIEKIFDSKNRDFWKIVFYGYQLNLIDNIFLIELATELLATDRLNNFLIIDLAALSEKKSAMAGIILGEYLKIDFFTYEDKVGYNTIWFSLLLNEKINLLLSKIKSSETVQDSEFFFSQLHIIQGSIIKLIVNDESIALSTNLKEFVYDFERIEDKSTQEFVFKKIKNGSYIPT